MEWLIGLQVLLTVALAIYVTLKLQKPNRSRSLNPDPTPLSPSGMQGESATKVLLEIHSLLAELSAKSATRHSSVMGMISKSRQLSSSQFSNQDPDPEQIPSSAMAEQILHGPIPGEQSDPRPSGKKLFLRNR